MFYDSKEFKNFTFNNGIFGDLCVMKTRRGSDGVFSIGIVIKEPRISMETVLEIIRSLNSICEYPKIFCGKKELRVP